MYTASPLAGVQGVVGEELLPELLHLMLEVEEVEEVKEEEESMERRSSEGRTTWEWLAWV